MAESLAQKLDKMIRDESETLKDPNVSLEQVRKNIKAKRDEIMKTQKSINAAYEMVADYLFTEGYASSFQDALIVADVISEEWYENILEVKITPMTPRRLAQFYSDVAKADEWERKTGSRLSPSEQAAAERLSARLRAEDEANARKRQTGQTTLGMERSTTARRKPRTNLGSVEIR